MGTHKHGSHHPILAVLRSAVRSRLAPPIKSKGYRNVALFLCLKGMPRGTIGGLFGYKNPAQCRILISRQWGRLRTDTRAVRLAAVPDLPFGHLHASWKKFLESVDPDDALWTFNAHWTTNWGYKELGSGYAVVPGEAIGPHFLTIWKTLEDE